jgi:predicted FMN-binding regulatory protein PaiB
MSQNREMKDRAGVVRGLRQRGEGDDLETAEVVLRHTRPRD